MNLEIPGMNRNVVRLLTVALTLLVVACATDVDDGEDSSVDGDTTPDETAAPTPGEEVQEHEGDSAPTPEAQDVDEWLQTAPTFQGIAQGPDGEYYVSYPRHAAILMLSPEGELVDAWGEEVRLPSEIAVDDEGTVYVVDTSAINRYGSDGSYLGRIGEFGFEAGQLAEPFSIAHDSGGNLFVTEEPGGAVKKFSPDGDFLVEWADPQKGAVRPATFIASDSSDNLYLVSQADQLPFQVQVRTPEQEVIDEWEVHMPEASTEGSDAPAVPNGIAVGSDDLIHVLTLIMDLEAEPRGRVAEDYQISIYELDGDLVASWLAVGEAGVNEPLAQPGDLTVTDDGNLILVDSGPDSHRIQRFTADGEFLGEWQLDVPAFLCELGPSEFEGLSC